MIPIVEAVKTKLAIIKIGLIMFLIVAPIVGLGVYHWTTVSALEDQVQELTEQKATVEAKLKLVEADNAILKQNVGSLETALTQQNAKVSAWVANQQAQTGRALAAMELAKKESAKWKGQYSKLLGAPRSPGTACEAFSDKLDQYLELRRKETTP